MKGLNSAFFLALASCAGHLDYNWPMFGRDASRNAVSPEKDAPTDWSTNPAEERNIAWKARLGDMSFGAPVVSGGLVWVGTNNSQPRDPTRKGDAGVLMCFRERDGEFLYQHVSPRRGEDWKWGDWRGSPLRCSPLIEGDRLWFVNNQWEVICLDIAPLLRGAGPARELWKVDLVDLLGTEPEVASGGMGFGLACSIGASHRDMLYVSTGHGRSWKTGKVERPYAPAFACINKDSGEILGREASGISGRMFTANWSSPITASVAGADGRKRTIVVFGGGDGFLYAFDPVPIEHPKRPEVRILKEIWRADCTAKGAATGFSSTPVVYDGRVYAAIGEFETGGPGNLCCVNLATGKVEWRSEEVGSTASTPVVYDGLVFAPDTEGFLHCLDAKTGSLLWRYDFLSMVSTSPVLVDGNLFVATLDDEVTIFDCARLTERARRLKMPVQVQREQKRIILTGKDSFHTVEGAGSPRGRFRGGSDCGDALPDERALLEKLLRPISRRGNAGSKYLL